jgi:DNA-binding MarR family transcriptional regulator
VALTAAERVLLHLHGFWSAREPARETTQAGIGEASGVLRSHVPRTLRVLSAEGLVEVEEAHLRGRARRTRVYRLTEAGVRRARGMLATLDGTRVEIDGRTMTLGEARVLLRLSPLSAAMALDETGRLRPARAIPADEGLLERDDDLGVLRRWFAGRAPLAVVYGSKGIGKSALARAFVRSVPRTVWVDVAPDPAGFVAAIGRATGSRSAAPDGPRSVAAAVLAAFDGGARLLVLDGYGEASEDVVEGLAIATREARARPAAKMLVLAQETSPAYCRFYGRGDVDAGVVVERHLKGLSLEGTRAMLGGPEIEDEAVRRVFLLTKGCPLYLKLIREGDEDGLRMHSRFTKAEIRLLLYSGGALRASPSAS